MPITVTLTQTDSIVEGTGMMSGDPPRKVSVLGFISSGQSATPVALTFAAVNFYPAVFLGNIAADGRTFSGTYGWIGGVRPEQVTFERVP